MKLATGRLGRMTGSTKVAWRALCLSSRNSAITHRRAQPEATGHPAFDRRARHVGGSAMTLFEKDLDAMSIRDLIPWSRQENKVPAQVSAAGAASDPVLSLHREVNRLFEDFFHGFGVPSLAAVERGLVAPSVEFAETDKEIRVTAEPPGLGEKDVEVIVEEGVLTLRGKKKSEVEDKDRGYSERSYGRFERRVGLPKGI